MMNGWEIDELSGKFLIYRWRTLTAEEKPHEYAPTAQLIGQWLQDLRSRRAALEMYEVASGDVLRGPLGIDQSNVVKQIEDAFRRRALICLRYYRQSESGNRKTEEESQKPVTPAQQQAPRRPTKARDWIAIELVDDKGKPIPNERFRIELPDGSYAEGKLDGAGQARLSDIDPGTCQVTFPDMDGKEWKPA
jgi:hypothetical protein